MSARKRKPNESFDQYRINMKEEGRINDMLCKSRVPYIDEDTPAYKKLSMIARVAQVTAGKARAHLLTKAFG